MSEAPENAEIFLPTRFVCKGLRYDMGDRELQVVLHQVGEEPILPANIPERFWALKPTTKGFITGFVYTVEASTGSIRPGTMKLVGEWGKLSDVDEWRALTIAARATLDDTKRLSKAKDDEGILKSLDPVRAAYRKTNSTGKIALELAVLRYLRR